MRKFNIDVPIVKVDEERRMVYGYATMEQIDSQDEIVDYEASKRAFSNWIGNIREQHDDKKAIGKGIEIRFDDENRGVWLGSHISESADGENTWTKIKERILTGYSIGGMINAVRDEVVQAADGTAKTIVRITDYVLGEVSVVDSPALGKFAEFVMIKNKDGKLTATDIVEPTERLFSAPWWMNKFADRYQLPNDGAETGYNNSSEANHLSNINKGDNMAEAIKKEEVKDEEVTEEVTEDAATDETETTEEVAEDKTETEEATDTADEASEEDSTEDADEAAEGEKSTKTADLEKATKTELSKLIDVVGDMRKELADVATLKKSVEDLKSQVETLSKAAKPAKAKADYAVVEKAEESDKDKGLAELEKQAKAYAADPNLGSAQERSDFVTKYMAAKSKR